MSTHETDRKEGRGLGTQEVIDSQLLKEVAFASGAGDVGFADARDPCLAVEAENAERLLAGARTFVSLVTSMNPANVRSPSMGVANSEFHFVNEDADRVAHDLAAALSKEGVRAVAVPAAFPMDAHLWPGKMWALSHKRIAEAAGLGRPGFSRNLLHPRFGTFAILSTVIVDRAVDRYGERLKRSPCIGCKVCARACPTGAIGEDGSFNFINCATHNYRYRLGGFVDWIESVARGRKHYRRVFSDSETVSMWQSLSCGVNYTCCNCMGACPAGTDHEEEYRADPQRYEREVVQTLLHRGDRVFVLAGSDAESRASAVFPADRVKRVSSGVRPPAARAFLSALPIVFQPSQAKGLTGNLSLRFLGRGPGRGNRAYRRPRTGRFRGSGGRR